MNFDQANPLDVLTAEAQESIAMLVTLRREVEIRKPRSTCKTNSELQANRFLPNLL
jgi:hypothetical protein